MEEETNLKKEVVEGAEAGTPQAATAPPHKYAERLGKAYPDRSFAEAEDYDKALDEYLDDLEDFKGKNKEINDKLIAIFEENPWIGDMVKAMIAGASGREALARYAPLDEITPIEGDPDYEAWGKAKKDREKSFAEKRKKEESYNGNIQKSQEALKAFAEAEGWDEDTMKEFVNKFDDILTSVNDGLITEEILQTMKKAFAYDNDLNAKYEEGKVFGRNENIAAKQEVPLQDDGLPHVNSVGQAETKKESSFGEKYADRLFNDYKKRNY